MTDPTPGAVINAIATDIKEEATRKVFDSKKHIPAPKTTPCSPGKNHHWVIADGWQTCKYCGESKVEVTWHGGLWI